MRSTWIHAFWTLCGGGLLAVTPLITNAQVRTSTNPAAQTQTNTAAQTQNTPTTLVPAPIVSGRATVTVPVGVPNTTVVPGATVVPNPAITGGLSPQLSPQTPSQMRSRFNNRAPTAAGSLQGGANPRFRGNFRIGGATGLQNDTRIFQSDTGVFNNNVIVTPQVVAPTIPTPQSTAVDINQNGIDDRIDSVGAGIPLDAAVVAPSLVDSTGALLTRGFVIEPFQFESNVQLSPIVQEQMIRFALQSGFPITSGQLNTELGTTTGGAGAMMNNSIGVVDWQNAFRPSE